METLGPMINNKRKLQNKPKKAKPERTEENE